MESGLDATESFWGLLLFSYLALLAWLVILFLRGDQGAHNNDAEQAELPSEPPVGSFRDWLDHKANILISRRPKHHKRRHQHQHKHR